MPLVEWNDGFLLGIDEFDRHHQHLVTLLNKTYDEFEAGAPVENLGSLLQELLEYTGYHFASEEKAMQLHAYPSFGTHKDEHARFIQRVTDMNYDFHKVNRNVSLEIITFLKDWLLNHILKTDAEFVMYLTLNDWDGATNRGNQ